MEVEGDSVHETLYIKNLNDHVSKKDLTESLYHLFSSHGRVISVVCKRGPMRGQAFVVFSKPEEAAGAMQRFQGMNVFGKDMVIEFARNRSASAAAHCGEFATAMLTKTAKDKL
ncbi:U1 small nuclear ribonucleoprotein A/U2 small nuclear ribonucleoprotein B'' [Kipferlia bialata]|uniref:U1 small nuclear ribonucleoprotein A/U2 small nuclear ribonucleoprotein B n=1 Tax=Kipferlia bialata TaxID=797122 RepID=A0A391NTR9_9EUKA|nr:U1 small nuclear ribonucleoprotein A/U2 small nuclear ribonucleoprotein B'' [Kipferlia bialata]|eukprot:g4803.t1